VKKGTAIVGLIMLFALTASAQEETFLGYSHVRFNPTINVPAFSANGGSGRFVNKRIGAVAAVHTGNITSGGLDSSFAHFLFVARLTLYKRSRLSPYVQVLWGGVFDTSSTRVGLLLPRSARTSTSAAHGQTCIRRGRV
jgi:hypothetical protein